MTVLSGSYALPLLTSYHWVSKAGAYFENSANEKSGLSDVENEEILLILYLTL